ncbi:MAG: hypothetical protein AABW41_00565 [Nanoarchaeota archaeon]
MVLICLIALPIFAILSIFSVKYRKLTKESLNCLFKTVTFRKCDADLDNRVKAYISSKLMKFPSLARIFYKNFKIITWILLIIMLVSTFYSARSAFYYAKYGSCNGPHSTKFCILNPSHTGQVHCDSEHCDTNGCTCDNPKGNCTPENNANACDGNCTCKAGTCSGNMQMKTDGGK